MRASTSVLSYPCPEPGRSARGRAQQTRVEGGGELSDLVHPGLATVLGHEGRAPALEEGGLEPVEGGVHGLGLVAAQDDVEGDGAHALGVHLVELTGVVDLVSRLEVAVHLLGAVARSQER